MQEKKVQTAVASRQRNQLWLLEDLVREQERQETIEAPTVPAPPVPHMPYSALEGAQWGFLNPEQIQDFVERSNVAKSVAKMRSSGPPMIPPAPPPVPAQVPRTLPPPPRIPARVHRDRFQPYPPLQIMPFPAPVVHPAPMVFPPPVACPTQMVPKPAPTMARWIARGTPVPTEAPKTVPTEVPTTHRHLLRPRCCYLLQRQRHRVLQLRCRDPRHR